MNETMDAKEPCTDASGESAAESPAGVTPGAGQERVVGELDVLQVFRQDKASLAELICFSVITEIVLWFLFKINPQSPLLFLILLAFTFVPSCIVRRRFIDGVSPICRFVCSETGIVSGTMKSLLHLWKVCFLCMFPLIVFVFMSIIFHDPWTEHPYNDFGGSIVTCYVVAILGDCPLAIFPVARLFSRRSGMIAMLVLIILGQIILLLNILYLLSGFVYFTDGFVKVKETNAFAGTLSFICLMMFAFGSGYFIRAAYTGAEEEGLPDTDNEPQTLQQQRDS